MEREKRTPHAILLRIGTPTMSNWCTNCQTETTVIIGKGEITICRACGCEMGADEVQVAPLSTMTLYGSFLDLESGLAERPGELADAPSVLGTPKEIELSTSKYLPEEFFTEQERLQRAAAEIDETWGDDRLLERIDYLEQTFELAVSLTQPSPSETPVSDASAPPRAAEGQPEVPLVKANTVDIPPGPPSDTLPTPPKDQSSKEPSSSRVSRQDRQWRPEENPKAGSDRERSNPIPKSIPLVRIDPGHVATPEQIRGRSETTGRAAEIGGGTSAGNRHPAHNTPNPSQTQPERLPNLRVDSSHGSAIPIARPIPPKADWSTNLDATDENTNPVSFFDSKEMTALGMGTAWTIQMLIGLGLLSSGPLSLWSLWLVAETVGTICLARMVLSLLNPKNDGLNNQPNSTVRGPSSQSLPQRESRSIH